jgi:K+-sensing histidine kinase KdpD
MRTDAGGPADPSEFLLRDAQVIQAISEELRTPLTVALGAIKTIGMRTDDADIHTIVEAAASPLSRLHELADVLLVLTEAGTLERSWAEAKPDVRTVTLRELQSRLRDQLATFAIKGRLAYVGDGKAKIKTIHPHLLVQSIRFLVANALRDSPETAKVTISGERSRTAAVLRVTDAGQHVSEEILAFSVSGETEPFSGELGIQGIALYASRRIASTLGATLEVVALPSGGTEATITLRQ